MFIDGSPRMSDGLVSDAARLARIVVDVTGMSMSSPQVDVTADGRDFEFVLSAEQKAGRRFQLAACFSKSVLSDAVFNYPLARRMAVLMESPIDVCYQEIDEVVRRFPLVLTHQRALIARGPPFLPLMFGTNWLGASDVEATSKLQATLPEKTGLVSFLGSLDHANSGAYRFRREIAELALRRGDVECFGKGIRPVAGKYEAIAPFRFSIAMENAASDYYFSEKLIDCLLLETVPIYYGCPGIGDMFDERGMLCFRTADELVAILDSLTPERYRSMLPYARANKERAISEHWHNHAALFKRLAEVLPSDFIGAADRACRPASRFTRLWRRWSL